MTTVTRPLTTGEQIRRTQQMADAHGLTPLQVMDLVAYVIGDTNEPPAVTS